MGSPAEEKQDRAFLAHLEDLFYSVQKNGCARFSTFLDLHQQKLLPRVTVGFSDLLWMLWGGHDEAERLMLGVFPAGETPHPQSFPLFPVTFRFRKEDAPTHRDFLGALMNLRLKREAIGDLMLEQTMAVGFFTETAAQVVVQELCKVGRCGVKPVHGKPDTLPVARRYEDVSVQVSSLRLDCAVSALCNLSREKSAQMIRSQLVMIDGAITTDISKILDEGAVLSLRGYGKYLFEQLARMTKKGRLVLLCKKYV